MMRLLSSIALILAACATSATDRPPIITELADARATTTIVAGGHHTELVGAAGLLATMDWDDASQSATISMKGVSRTLMIDSALGTPEHAGQLTYAALHAEVDKDAPQGAWEDWCVFCSYDEYGILYCYWVPFCCGWPYDTCRGPEPDAGPVAPTRSTPAAE